MTLNNNSTADMESWFIPFDIIMILCTIFAVILAVICLVIIIYDKACHTVPMLLAANSILAEFIFGVVLFGMALFALENDLKQIDYPDSLCIFLGYISYVTVFLENSSYTIQAVYRYITVVYPARLFCQSARFQTLVICSTWIFGFVYPLPLLLTHEIKYIINNQICQMPIQLSFFMIYCSFCVYAIPHSITMIVYFKLVRYVQEMSKRATPVNTLNRAKSQLKMVRRIVILIFGVVILGIPYVIFIIMSFFTDPPKYHFRIAFLFGDASLPFVMIALFQFTDPLKEFIIRKINVRTNLILPTVT
jgi:hypothetical protein